MAEGTMGYTTLQVIPVMQGSTSALEGQLTGPLMTAGRSAGQAAGRAVASGLEQARAAVERASATLAAARDKEADAIGKVRIAETKLEELRRSGRATASQLARAEEALASAQRGAARANQATRTATDNLARARADAANATDDAAEAEGRFSRALGALNDRVGPAAKQMGGLAAATAGVGGAMATVAEAMSREQSVDVLAAQLDATPAMAAEYGRVAGELYKRGLGESFADVTQAVGAVESGFATLGFEGEASLDKVTESALNFSRMFGTDIPNTVQTASQLLTNGLAKDSTEAFDLMVTSMSRVPVAMRDELPEIINEYGTHFRGLGFSGEQAFSLLVDYAGQGKWALDKAGDALKEFTLRGSDMSKSSQAAYEAIKLDAQEMSDAIAAGGPRAQDALQRTAQGLLAVEGESERANLAIALFGTPVEDLAVDQIPAFLSALAGGSDSMAGFAGAADRTGQTLNDNTAGALERVKRSIQSGLVSGLTDAASWMEQNRGIALGLGIAVGALGAALITAKVAATGYAVAQGVMAAATGAGTAALAGNSLALGAYTIATGVVRGATVAWTAVQWLLNAALTANPIGLVVVAIAALVAGVVLAYQRSETFREIVKGALDAVTDAALWLWHNALEPFVNWWVGNAVKAWEAFTTLSEKAGEAKDFIVGKFADLVTWLTGLPGKVTSALSGMWTGLTDGFKSALNWLISAWNNFRLHWEFTVPVIDKKVSFTIDTPDLPMLAGGGVAGVDRSGRIYGPGSGTSDSILAIGADGVPTAMVSAGEGVVRKSAMDRGGAELVAALNAGWVPPLEMLRAMLPGLAEGGLAEAQAWARRQAGLPYQYGGTGNPSWDCSGFMSGIYAVIMGKDPNTRHFTTESDFEALGFKPGLGGATDFSIGVSRGGGGPLSHMAGTLGDLNVESGSDGVEVGAGAQGAADFPLKWHLPILGDPGGLTSPGGGASGLGSGLGGGTGGGGAGTTGGTGGGGGSATRPAGTAVPVWVDNWPSDFGTSSTGSPSSPSGTSPSSFQPSGGDDEPFDQQAAFADAFSNAGKNFAGAGEAFLRGQIGAIPGVGGQVQGLEKVVQNITLVVADVAEAVNRITREQKRQTAGKR
ncbi:phage tail tape measure protein [Nocardia otitidiscaviarum]|uniref:phage tail tape measure protein n=1 Tax=Nocardia otitidiscaviarum TaxID=1823 RepID=UPI0011DE2A5E|nr:phage tail tape measure protein [Nocardia otitidiscaviarum]